MATFDTDLDYLFCATVDEVLLTAIEQIENARQARTNGALGTRLKMASKTMQCALEIYRDWLANQVRKEGEDERLQNHVDARQK